MTLLDSSDLRRRAEMVRGAGIGHAAGPMEILALLDLAARLKAALAMSKSALMSGEPFHETGCDSCNEINAALAAAREAKL